MKRTKAGASSGAALLSCLLLFSACDGFFTTSVASFLARSIDYSSLSLDELLVLATTRGATSSEAAKEILAALAKFSEEELLSLTTAQKESILTTAVTATLDLDSLLTLVNDIDSLDSSDLLSEAMSLANSDVDMTAVTTLLTDEETLATASVDTLILASVAVVTTVEDNDIDDVTSAIESKDTSGLDGDLVDTADILIGVADVLQDDRADEVSETSSSLGFDLSSLIPGFSSSSSSSN